jgi:site-specific recombinase XerD
LHHEDYITDNPAQRLKLPPLPIRQIKGLATTDRNRIIAQAKSKRDFAICLFLSDTACRAAGLCNLKLDDLDLEHCRATVREKGRGGNHKERVIFYTTATAQAITRMLDAKPSSLYVFTKQNGGRLTEQALYKILRRLAKKAGITQGYNPHAWRHGAIRHMLNQGMHLAAASQIAGHSSIKVTGDIYGSQDTNTLQTLHDAYAWTYTTT